MRNHFTASHKGTSPIGNQTTTILQGFYLNYQRAFFPVQHEDVHFDRVSLYTSFLAARKAEAPPPVQPLSVTDQREISPLIRRLGWSDEVRGHSPQELHRLIQLPSKDKEDEIWWQVRLWVHTYLEDTHEEIQKTPSEYLLRLLNSESSKELNHTPMRALQESLLEYATCFSRLLFLLLRWTQGIIAPDYPLPLDESQLQQCRQILHLLQQRRPRYDKFQPIYQSLMVSLLSTTHAHSPLERLVSPLRCFIIISSLRPDGSWELPTAITPTLAKLQWAFRVVVYKDIALDLKLACHQSLDAEEVTDLLKRHASLLYDGQLTPFADLLQMKHLINFFAYQQQGLPTVHWLNPRKTRIMVNGEEVRLLQMRMGIQQLHQDVTSYMATELLHDLPVHLFPVDRLGSKDSLRNAAVGYSVIEDERNLYKSTRWNWIKGVLESEDLLGE